MDTVIFTGKIPLEVFKEERPREYQQLIDERRLEEELRRAPSVRHLFWAKLFGFSALAIGFSLVILIIVSILRG